MTQWLIEEAVYERLALMEARVSSGESHEPEPGNSALAEALEKARHFAATGKVL